MVIIHQHALKHGLSETQIVQAVQTGSGDVRVRSRDENADPPRWAVIGFDADGRPIEVIAVVLVTGEPMIIHANYLTLGFLNEMRRAR